MSVSDAVWSYWTAPSLRSVWVKEAAGLPPTRSSPRVGAWVTTYVSVVGASSGSEALRLPVVSVADPPGDRARPEFVSRTGGSFTSSTRSENSSLSLGLGATAGSFTATVTE